MKTAWVFAGGFVAGVGFLFMVEVAAFIEQADDQAVAISTYSSVVRDAVASSRVESQRVRQGTLDRQLQVERERIARRRPGDACVNGTLVRRSVVNGVPTVEQDLANSDLCK